MPVQKHLFVLDPLERLNLKLDSSLRVAHALTLRGHEAYMTHVERMGWRTGTPAFASVSRLTFVGDDPTSAGTSLYSTDSLANFTAIHMRKDPPFDMDYVATTWLLDAAGTRVYNSPAALRTINEKLAVLMFPQFSRPALVSADAEALLNFIVSECHGDGIIKPLELFGGRGVTRITLPDANDVNSRKATLRTLANETGDGHHFRLVQAFDPAIFHGEVRAFAAFGEPLAWCLKRPADGNFLANTAAGASLTAYDPSREEIATVKAMAGRLFREGVAFVGFDIIGGHISEMNLTSPRLLTPPGDPTDYYGILAERLIEDVARS